MHIIILNPHTANLCVVSDSWSAKKKITVEKIHAFLLCPLLNENVGDLLLQSFYYLVFTCAVAVQEHI